MPAPPPLRCSSTSLAVGEEPIGSAPSALAWVCLEQPGSWGPKAFTSSHLDPEIGRAFETAANAAGVRPQLIRSPGRHPITDSATRTMLIAFTAPGSSWLLTGRIDRPERILDLDFTAIAAGVPPDWPELAPQTEPVLLVCTNGRRDLCCAESGRDVAARAGAVFPARVWETNHLSGHRFAATTTLLPSGDMHARVLDGSTLLHAADESLLVPTGWRGRSTWPRAAQAAEWAVRQREGIWDLDAATVTEESGNWRVTIADRSWLISVEEYTDGMAPPSCGKAPEPVRRFDIAIR